MNNKAKIDLCSFFITYLEFENAMYITQNEVFGHIHLLQYNPNIYKTDIQNKKHKQDTQELSKKHETTTTKKASIFFTKKNIHHNLNMNGFQK